MQGMSGMRMGMRVRVWAVLLIVLALALPCTRAEQLEAETEVVSTVTQMCACVWRLMCGIDIDVCCMYCVYDVVRILWLTSPLS